MSKIRIELDDGDYIELEFEDDYALKRNTILIGEFLKLYSPQYLLGILAKLMKDASKS